MSVPNGAITLSWADGEYTFNLAKIKCILELEEKCNAGIGTIYSRLLSGMALVNATFYFNDFRETLRLGLIGGGLEPAQALKLVQRYVDERPWAESIRPALAVVAAAVVGVKGDDDVGKGEADQQETGLFDPPSTETARL